MCERSYQMGEHERSYRFSQGLVSSDVIIFGRGKCARKIAANLADHNIDAWLVSEKKSSSKSANNDALKWLNQLELLECQGFANDFKLIFKQKDAVRHARTSAIIVAEDYLTASNIESCGLVAHQRIFEITSLEKKIADGTVGKQIQNGSRIVFLSGWNVHCESVMAKRMLIGCLQLQQHLNVSTLFLTGHLKVAADGAEAICLQAKKYGSVFAKFTHDFPNIQALPDGRYQINYIDEMTRSSFSILADWLVIDETIKPARDLNHLARKLAIERDRLGFAQKDNVHRLNHATNRHGIFVAGGARAMLSEDELMADADQVTLKVLAFLNCKEDQPSKIVDINRGRCARCLTCHRHCPHRAVRIGSRITVVTEACQSCGICLSVCPSKAIDMDGLSIEEEIRQSRQKAHLTQKTTEKGDNVIVFGCSRSAGQAYKLIQMMGKKLPAGVQFIEIPCGGAISTHHLLAAFDAGVDGVMLCTCHIDNCKSDKGNQLACKRIDASLNLLIRAGIDNNRLLLTTVAANMGNAFYTMINAFVNRIRSFNFHND